MEHLGDITQLKGNEIPKVDIITGGSPCQDLSVAGKREGLAGERSGLFMEQIRLIKEMRESDRADGRSAVNIRPRFMVWENVPGAFSSNKGEDFRCVIEETAKIADSNATIPRLKEDRNGKQKWSKSGAILGDGWSIAWRVHDAQFWGVPQRRKRISLVADFAGGAATEILFEPKSLYGNTETSREEGQGTTTDAERSVGETGITCLNDQGGSVMGVSENVVGALRAQEHGHQPLVFEPGAASRVGGHIYEDIAGTLDASYYKGCGERQGVERTIVAQETPMVWNGKQTMPTLSASNADGSQRMPDKDNFNAVIQQSVVRRLTPLECEKLQGYPDGWTDIGEWYDSKGKKHKDADSPRYKALGNSIALPFWEWMAKRMVKHINHEVTMGSLFDGIGGFPLVFSRAGAKPIWASEIEEFPIAVTKLRFKE